QAQHPKSFEPGQEYAHDERLFIVIHQAFELWFRQILFELDYVIQVFSKEKINDNSEDMNLVVHRLQRVQKIMELLNQQVTVLDTMTPLDFLEFRNLLTPASGFQSVQFRLIEATLGLEMQHRHKQEYYKRVNQGGFNEADLKQINEAEGRSSIIRLLNRWLERMPFFDLQYWQGFADPRINRLADPDQNNPPIRQSADPLISSHPFWNSYRHAYQSGLTENEIGKIIDFDYVFLEKELPDDMKERSTLLRGQLSAAAMRSALFIMLYRDFPVFQQSFRVLDILIEIDNALAAWRHAHFRMVRRMIGMRVGTGNTTGSGYLEGAASSHYIFRDLAGLSTYLIERKKQPSLPEELIRSLSYNR
ncbi:MAG TPA: tryptophan 2,3-dioxygenase family protein, partial [Chitinophagaceae bacterium]|nr:tryptophan 2,3-dioxygenase family protein [Chitinophagaceae bacterium]